VDEEGVTVRFKFFSIVIEGDEEKFIEELDALCKRHAKSGTAYHFRYDCEE
jgi:hypothetical protein